MKKILLLGFIGIMCLMGNVARAQFDDYGVKFGLGTATIADDLGTKSPILGANLGGYINFTFKHSQTALAEVFYLQTGLNMTRRGNLFEETFENGNTLSIREGYHHVFYLQLPVLAGVHMELPIREPGHVVGFFLGPAFNYGLFGRYADRMVTPGYTSHAANYDVNFNGTDADKALFNHIKRFDVSAILGVSYEHGNYTFSLFVDHGFVAVSEGIDVLSTIINNLNTTDPTTIDLNDLPKYPDGNNNAVIFSVSYKLGTLLK